MATYQKIVRTSDGIQFAIESDEPPYIDNQVGELLRTKANLSDAVKSVTDSVIDELRRSGASKASISFGLALSAGGAFFITQGQAESHVIVSLEFDRDPDSTYFRP